MHLQSNVDLNSDYRCIIKKKKEKKKLIYVVQEHSETVCVCELLGLFPDHSSPWGVSATSLSNNASTQFAATSVEARSQTGQSSSTTTVSPPALLLPHLDHCNAQTGCRGQTDPTCPPWGRGGRRYRAPGEPGRGGRQEMMNGLLQKQPYPRSACFSTTLFVTKRPGSESERSNLCQDKVNTAGFVHVVRQVNPLADPGVTFGCGRQDVRASVQQPPVVAVIG